MSSRREPSSGGQAPGETTTPVAPATAPALLAGRGVGRTERFDLGAVRLRGGRVLPSVTVEAGIWGTLAADGGNAVLVCHSFTADAFAAGTDPAARPDHRPWRIGRTGWWDALIGPGRAIDTDRWCVVCCAVLGGSGGTTGPGDPDPATGRPWGWGFPAVTVEDLVGSQRRVQERLGIPRWRLVVGGSLGGLQALTWAATAPGSVGRALVVAATHRPTEPGIRHFAAGRALIAGDPSDGGAGLLRALAHARRWSGGGAPDAGGWEGDWPRERFHPASYVRLAEAIERFDLARDLGGGSLDGAAARIRAPLDLVAYRGDRLFTPVDARALAAAVRRTGGAATVTVMDGPDGHDTFLTQPSTLADALRRALPE